MQTRSPGFETQVLEHTQPLIRSPGLLDRLEATRQGIERFRRTRWLVVVSLTVLALAGVLATADWLWMFGAGVRTAGLLVLALVAVALLGRGLVGSARRFGRQDVAADVETTFPALGQRIRTTLEYSEPTPETPPASADLVQALALDTGRRTAGMDFRNLIPWRSLRGLQASLIGLATLFGVLLCWHEEARTAALRLLLVPVHYTRLEVKPGDHTVRAGSDVAIEATVSGRPVDNVELNVRPPGSEEWERLSLALPDLPGDGPQRLLGNLGTTLKDCDRDLEYRVVAGQVESPVYHLSVKHPLVLKKFEATIQPPAYTRRPSATVTQKDFKVIAGSAVRLRITLDRPPASAKLLLYPSAGATTATASTPPVALEVRENVLTGELASIQKEMDCEIVAEAADGMRLEGEKFRIRVQPDQRPTVRFVKPREQVEVTPTTEVRMKVEAGDDFGLARVGIVYQVGSGPKKTLHLHQDPKQPLKARIEATLALEEHELGFQESVTYFAFAEDNHPTHPQRTTTELQFIDIRPYKRAYQSVEGGGCCNGKSVSLEELIARQRQNLRQTFAQSEKTTADALTCKRLASTQSELAEATAEFTAGLEERFGPVPCLHKAQDAMKAAVAALQQNNAKGGVAGEETALAGLIQARKNVRQMLSDSKCASQCRKFDAKQKQKLRKPPKKDTKAELAQLQKEIEQLAKEEKKLSEEIAPPSGGAQLEPNDQASKKEGSSSGSSAGKGKASASKKGLGERQAKAARKADELRQRVEKDKALTDLARERMDAAAGAIGASKKSLEKGQDADASRQAADAAAHLDRLARQVAGLKAPDLTTRLANAQNLARQLAGQQQALEKDLQGSADRAGKPGDGKKKAAGQRGAAEEARTLADLLDRLGEDAAGAKGKLGEALRQASEANPPGAIAKQMRRAADALQAGKSEQARRDVGQSARGLDDLAGQLEAARRGLGQSELASLIAAEKKVAEAQKALGSVNNERQKAAAGQKVADLRETMEALEPGDGKVAKAAEALAQSVRAGGGWNKRETPHDPRIGAYVPPVELADSVHKVVKALQVRIQKIILKDALLDRDEAVPPQFKALVEEYYRALSDDLR